VEPQNFDARIFAFVSQDRQGFLLVMLKTIHLIEPVLCYEGDRHPSNLLLDRNSGKILHIDFGDCFEVAMTREKFPEKIPFRSEKIIFSFNQNTFNNKLLLTGTSYSILKVLEWADSLYHFSLLKALQDIAP
jgi:hypothetical protein